MDDTVAVAKAELTSLLIKKDRGLVVWVRLKRMYLEVTNMAPEFSVNGQKLASNKSFDITLSTSLTVYLSQSELG